MLYLIKIALCSIYVILDILLYLKNLDKPYYFKKIYIPFSILILFICFFNINNINMQLLAIVYMCFFIVDIFHYFFKYKILDIKYIFAKFIILSYLFIFLK